MRSAIQQLLQTDAWFALCIIFFGCMLLMILFVAREAWHYRNMTIKAKKRYHEQEY